MSKPELNPFTNITACEKCPDGKHGPTIKNAYSDFNYSCTDCQPGQFTTNTGSNCTAVCPLGTFIGGKYKRTCVNCQIGKIFWLFFWVFKG